MAMIPLSVQRVQVSLSYSVSQCRRSRATRSRLFDLGYDLERVFATLYLVLSKACFAKVNITFAINALVFNLDR
jgi:hypothetical protein